MDASGECLGVVLAGGRSQRMGADKAGLIWKGRRLLDHAVALLTAAGCSRVVVSGDHAGYEHIQDRYPERGPLGGLTSVAEQVVQTRWLVVAVDQPLLDRRILHLLLDGLLVGAELGRQVCRFGEEPLPMALLVTAATRQWMHSAVTGRAGHRSLKGLQDCLRIHALPADAEMRARLVGANTPEQWQALQSMG
jgi:molybdenum cofactor guanylyltransferase